MAVRFGCDRFFKDLHHCCGTVRSFVQGNCLLLDHPAAKVGCSFVQAQMGCSRAGPSTNVPSSIQGRSTYYIYTCFTHKGGSHTACSVASDMHAWVIGRREYVLANKVWRSAGYSSSSLGIPRQRVSRISVCGGSSVVEPNAAVQCTRTDGPV